jgi:multiple sugar transport system substrate-binding protein
MKTIVFVLVLLLSVSSLILATPQGEEAVKPITLTFYHYASQTHILYINPLKENFQKAFPNITIEAVEVASGGYEALSQKILLGLAAGEPPDVGQVGYTLLRTMVESGSAIPLDGYMNSDPAFRKDNLFPAMMSLGQADGKQYLVPLGTSTPAMFNNMDLFNDVGLDPESPPKSWADARAAAAKFKARDHLGIFWGWQVTGNWIFQAMLENLGGKMANEAGTAIMFNDAKGLRVLEYLWDLTRNGLMPVTDQGLGTFVAGNLGMWVDSSFQRVNTPQQANFPVRMSPMPTPDGSLPRVPAGGNGIMLFAKDEAKRSAAWNFIRWITEEEASRLIAANSGYTPANQAVIQALIAQHADDKNYKVTLDQAARVVPWYSWPGKNGNKISAVLKDMQEAVIVGSKAPKQALDEAAAEVTALLK